MPSGETQNSHRRSLSLRSQLFFSSPLADQGALQISPRFFAASRPSNRPASCRSTPFMRPEPFFPKSPLKKEAHLTAADLPSAHPAKQAPSADEVHANGLRKGDWDAEDWEKAALFSREQHRLWRQQAGKLSDSLRAEQDRRKQAEAALAKSEREYTPELERLKKELEWEKKEVERLKAEKEAWAEAQGRHHDQLWLFIKDHRQDLAKVRAEADERIAEYKQMVAVLVAGAQGGRQEDMAVERAVVVLEGEKTE